MLVILAIAIIYAMLSIYILQEATPEGITDFNHNSGSGSQFLG